MTSCSWKSINKVLAENDTGSLDMTKPITIIIQTITGMAIFTIDIADTNEKIKTCEVRVAKLKKFLEDYKKKDDVDTKFVEKLTFGIKYREVAIERDKVGKMIHLAFINKTDLSTLGGLYIAKMNKLFSLNLELMEELVELGQFQEAKYLENAMNAKKSYCSIEEQVKAYNNKKNIIFTNIKVIVNE